MSPSPFPGRYPTTRLRRLRQTPWLRRLAAETTVTVDQLIWPCFVRPGENASEPVASMPGVERYSVDRLVDQVREAADLGIPAIALFPATEPERRSPDGREATNPDNLMCRAIRAVKAAVPDIGVIGDVALDPYTTHGHDGLMDGETILNDETLEVLVRQALVMAEAGLDVAAPSDMMDGRIGTLRSALDGAGHRGVVLLSYAAKYSSAYYGPFRDAVGSNARLIGDKRTYQMNPANSDEALREIELDLAEGADMVMVKPGLPYLDIIRRARDTFGVPVMAYQVSGEYASMRAACDQGWLSYPDVLMETLMAFSRAGCSGILTYAAKDAARILAGSSAG
ncbi:MAG: porphobilinogen synthase [Rhodospirillaceae bacterium]|nr:porphobilinogen synthase [Rhodospirillaceae bacterium]